jgi:hypothetical protein
MFGQNNSQTPATNPDPAVPPAPAPANPFAENDSPVPPAPAPESVVAPTPLAPPTPADPIMASPAPAPVIETPATAAPDDLLGLKQQALQSLQPLVSKLDQSPEEKFKTTMMMMQATDNPGLVKQAYEAASQITDEKTRAQALLDVVNEINYFTHKDDGAPAVPKA